MMDYVCIHRISIWSYCLKCDDVPPAANMAVLVPTGPIIPPVYESVAV